MSIPLFSLFHDDVSHFMLFFLGQVKMLDKGCGYVNRKRKQIAEHRKQAGKENNFLLKLKWPKEKSIYVAM